MITIVKGSSKIVTTRGAYEEQFKKLGYQIASEKKGATKQVAPLFKKEEENQVEKPLLEDKEEEDLSEKFGLKTSKKKGK